MKKVLFATTALVATAGIAAAEVSISGGAEFGVIGGDRYSPEVDGGTTDDAQFMQSVDVRFKMSGETDNGLSFGAQVDLNDAAEQGDVVDVRNDTFADFTVFLKGGFGTLTMGDTDGALDWALQEVNLAAGSIDDAETEHAGFNGNSGLDGINDGQVLRYDYSFGDFGVAASVSLDDDEDDTDLGGDAYGLGFKYDLDLGGAAVGFGLGFQTADDVDIIGLSIDGDFGNGFVAGINYSELDYDDGATELDASHWAIGVGYTMDALAIGLNYGEYDVDGGDDIDGWGLAVQYDLGGGAAVQFGYGDGSDDEDNYSLGIAMSF